MRDIPPSWLKCRVGDVMDYGTTTKVEPSEIGNDSWVLELEDIEKDSSRLLARRTMADRQSKSTKNQFRRGDVLYSKLRPYLNKVLLANADGFCTTEIVPLNGHGDLDNRFIFYWLKHPEFLEYVGAVSHGLNMPRLGTEAGKNAPFVLAPLNEQKRIADKLDSLFARVEACRECLDRIPQIFKRLFQSVLRAAVSGSLTENGQSAIISVRSEINSPRGEPLPPGWRLVQVQDVAQIGTGSTPLRSNPNYYATAGTPWITSAATGQPLIAEAHEFVTEWAIKDHRLKTYPVGTLIVALYGEGKTRGQVSELAIAATINQACAAINPDESIALPAYVKLALQANYFEMRELAEGGNQPNLNLTKIKEFPLPLPPMAEQREISRLVAVIFDFANRFESRFESSRSKLNAVSSAILSKAFRGELLPQDPTDESADVLLNRLRSKLQGSIEERKTSRRQIVGKKTVRRKEIVMLNRKELAPGYLAELLREHGPLTAESLWAASKLDIDDFYEVLRDEEASGMLKEIRSEDPNVPRTLEAA